MKGKTVTVFGGSGFIGRSLVKRLARSGASIRAVSRQPELAGHLRPLGEVGQIALIGLDRFDDDAVAAATGAADHVVNLVGILHENLPGDFDRVHADLAASIARAAAWAGAKSLVQVSAIGASSDSRSVYAQSKAKGETGVTAAFSDAAILRPSIVFGPGDGFFERFGDMAARGPILPLVNGGTTRFQPVFVGDVADAILRCTNDTSNKGVFELGGPKTYSFKELLEYLLQVIDRRRFLVPVSASWLQLPARLMEMLPEPMLTRDQLVLLEYDNVVSSQARTLADLGMTATPLESVVPSYMHAYATGGRAVFPA